MPISPQSNSLPDLLDALENHLVDYPTPENIHMQRKYLSDIRQHHTGQPDEGETADEIYQKLSKRAKIIGYELRKLSGDEQPVEMPMNNEGLLPCPFCGGINVSVKMRDHRPDIDCRDCDFSATYWTHDRNKQTATSAWNRRPPEREAVCRTCKQPGGPNSICSDGFHGPTREAIHHLTEDEQSGMHIALKRSGTIVAGPKRRESSKEADQIKAIKHILKTEDTYDEAVRKIEDILAYHPSMPISGDEQGRRS